MARFNQGGSNEEQAPSNFTRGDMRDDRGDTLPPGSASIAGAGASPERAHGGVALYRRGGG